MARHPRLHLPEKVGEDQCRGWVRTGIVCEEHCRSGDRLEVFRAGRGREDPGEDL